MKRSRPAVHVVVPTTGGMSDGLENWMLMHSQMDFPMAFEKLRQPNIGFIESARQDQANKCLAGPSDWFLFVDSDSDPMITAAALLAGAEHVRAKVVTGITPFHAMGARPGVHANVAQEDPKTGELVHIPWHTIPFKGPRYHPVKAAGLACMLIHREVLEKLMNEAERSGREEDYPFRARYERGIVKTGEDRMFCQRVYAAGYEILADLEAQCGHDKRWHMTPLHAIHDLPFFSPGEIPNPDAPKRGPMTPIGNPAPPRPLVEIVQ